MKASILYFDDEVYCLDVFREMFCDAYEIQTVSTLAEARRALEVRPADIVMSDQMMPDIAGKDFLREVAKAHPTSYRVLLTGAITVGSAVGEIGLGIIHAFAVKPWREEEMRRVLERASYFHAIRPTGVTRHLCGKE